MGQLTRETPPRTTAARGPRVRTSVGTTAGPGWRIGGDPATPAPTATALVGSGRALGRTLQVLRDAGGAISVVRDVGGESGAGLTDAVAAVRLQHLHLDRLVGDAPPIDTAPTDTPPTALVAAATTTSECPDVGVVVLPLARPRSTAERRRRLTVLAGVWRAPTGAPVVAVVDGGLGGSALPDFADLPACLGVLQFAHAHAAHAHDHVAAGAGARDGRWEP